MSNVLGSLEIQMLADLARLRQDMNEAKGLVGNTVNDIKRTMDAAKTALGALGLGLSVAGLAAWVKSAIDAGDEAYNMGKKVGMATKDLAGIQLAFKQGGVDAGGMQTALVKMAKSVAENSEVYARMGVNVRNADGSLKSSKQVLYEVADVFAKMPEGIKKTALATEVFGKAGADLVPTLDAGSEGLEEMAKMAEKLGLVIDDETAQAADEFNDTLELVGMTSQGMARRVAADLLPTLNALVGSLLENITQGDTLARAADVLSAGLKGLFSVGLFGAEVFNQLGKMVGGVAAVIVSAVQGEFGQARDAWIAMNEDMARSETQTLKTISDLWSGAGAVAVDQAKKMTTAVGGVNIATKEQAEAAKKAAEEEAKRLKAGQDYLDHLNAQFGAMQQEISLGRALTDGEKELLKLQEQITSGKIKLTDAQVEEVKLKLENMEATKAKKAAEEELIKTTVEIAKHSRTWNDEQFRGVDAMRMSNVQLLEENEKLRLTEKEWLDRQVAVLKATAADLEWQAASQGGNWALQEQARLLRERATLLQEGVALKEAKAAAEEWKKVTEQIQSGLTDSLYRAFEAGRGFFQTLWDGIVNTFKTTVLRVVVDWTMKPINAALGTLMGTAGPATAGTGGGVNGASLLDSQTYYAAVKNMAGSTGTAYSSFATSNMGQSLGLSTVVENGAGQGAVVMTAEGSAVGTWGGAALGAIAGHYAGRAISGGYSTGGSGNSNVNAGTAIGAVIGSIIPGIGTAIGAVVGGIVGGVVNRAFGHKNPQVQSQGVYGTMGSAGQVSGGTYTDWLAEGGWLRSDKRWTDTGAMGRELATVFEEGTRGVYQQATRYAQVLGLPTQALASVVSNFRVAFGSDEAANMKAIAQAFADYGETLTANYADAVKTVARGGETTTQTLERLGGSLLSVNGVFQMLGVTLAEASVAGGAAASDLLDLTGGLEAFLAKTQGYLQGYFTKGEQLGITSQAVLAQLGAVGIDFAGATSRQELRSLMETLDVNVGIERERMAALLNVAGDFAQITDYLQETGLTLGQLASQAPATSWFGRMTTDQVTDRAYALAAQSHEQLVLVNDNTAAAAQSLSSLVTLSQAGYQAMLDRLDAMAAQLAEASRPAYLNELAYPQSTGM